MATGFNPSRGPAETAVTTPEDDYRASLQPLVGSCWNTAHAPPPRTPTELQSLVGSCWNETFAPLREVAEPLVDNSDVVPYEILHEMGTLLHPWGRKYVHRSVFIDELTDDLHEFILERTKAAPGRMDGIGIWPMDEAVGSGNSSAFAWSDKAHLIVIEVAWESHDNRAHIEWATETERRLRDRGGEGAYPGYVGVKEGDWEDWSEDDLVDVLQSWVEADQPGQTSLDDPPFGDPPSEEPDSPQRPTGFDHQAGSPDGPTEEQPHDE